MANKKVTNEQLARMIARGFSSSNKIFQKTIKKTEERLNGRIDGLDGRVDGLDGKIDKVDDRIDEHREETRRGFKDIKEEFKEVRDDHYRLEARIVDVPRKQDLHDRKIKILEKS